MINAQKVNERLLQEEKTKLESPNNEIDALQEKLKKADLLIRDLYDTKRLNGKWTCSKYIESKKIIEQKNFEINGLSFELLEAD